MKRGVFVTDFHGNLPNHLPKADFLVIGGDIAPDGSVQGQADWFDNTFRKWLMKIQPNYEQVLAHFGNHDFAGEAYAYKILGTERAWKIFDSLPIKFVPFGPINLYGYSFLFNSWCLQVGRWALGASEDDYFRWCEQYDQCDVLVCHGPPRGMTDLAYRYDYDSETIGFESIGSRELASWVMKVRPTAILTGHCHEGYGCYDIEHYDGKITKVMNGCQVTRSLQYIYRPIEFFLP